MLLNNLSLSNIYNYKYRKLIGSFTVPRGGSVDIPGLSSCKIITLNGGNTLNGTSQTFIRTEDIQYFRVSDHLGISCFAIDYIKDKITNTFSQGTDLQDNSTFSSVYEVL